MDIEIKKAHLSMGVGLLLSVIVINGCARVGVRDDNERSNRIVARAYEMLELERYDEAVRLFEKTLDVYPTMARPHLDLAMVLHEQKQDYISAIYHYRRYLRLRPGTEKFDMIESQIARAEQALFEAYRDSRPINTADGNVDFDEIALEVRSQLESRLQAYSNQLVSLQQDLQAAQSNVSTLSVINSGLESERDRLATDVEVLKQRLEDTRSIASRDVVAASGNDRLPVVVPNIAEESAPRTYTVKPDDSLSVIAYKVYGDAARWRQIQNANRDVLGNSVDLRIGQVLVIP